MGFFKEVSNFFNKLLSKPNKKLVENCIIVIVIGVIAIIAAGAFLSNEKEEGNANENDGTGIQDVAAIVSAGEKDALESKLETIISQMDGVGKVNVMVTYISGKEIIPAYDIRRSDSETREKDSNGGTRDITESEYESSIVYEEMQGGVKKPVVIKDLQPVVKGVVVVAEGAVNPSVKQNISKAVEVLMDIPIHKIQVFEHKN